MSSEGSLKKQELQYLILSYLYIYDGAYRFLSSFAPVSDHHFEGDQNDFERSQSVFCDGLERLTKYYFCNKNNTKKLFYGDKFVSGDVLDNISYIYTNIINNPKMFRRTGKKLYINKNEITDVCDELLEWALYLFKDLSELLNLYSFYETPPSTATPPIRKSADFPSARSPTISSPARSFRPRRGRRASPP